MTNIRTLLSALLPVALCLTLVGTIYLTVFDLQWIAFLSGIFIAAVLAVSSRATSAEWRVTRRTRQIEKLKGRFSLQTALLRQSEQNLSDGERRNLALCDASESLIVYVDTAQVCGSHNLAFASAVGSHGAHIAGKTLREVLGHETHASVIIGLQRVLDGNSGQFAHAFTLGKTGSIPHTARFIADSAEGRVKGCWLLIREAAARDVAATTDFLEVPGAARGVPPAAGQPAATAATAGDVHYLKSMAEDLTGWADPKARFLEALAHDDFCLWYQPIRRAAPEVIGPDYAEILVRLQEEEDNLLPPGAFFPVAEHYHLMSALDRWVVSNLLDWYQTRRRQGEFPRFCINLSADSIVDETFIDFLREEIENHNLPGIALCFELAESDIFANPTDAVRITTELAAIGCEVTVDGFGGHSNSFSFLQDLAVNFLKIDGGIIANILRDPVCLAKARAITTAAHLTKRYTIAEFVESRDILKTVRGLGVDYVQGFGVAKPRPLSQLEHGGSRDSEVDLVGLDQAQPDAAGMAAPQVLVTGGYRDGVGPQRAAKAIDRRRP